MDAVPMFVDDIEGHRHIVMLSPFLSTKLAILKIAKELQLPQESIRLQIEGKPLSDTMQLKEYGAKCDSRIVTLLRLCGGGVDSFSTLIGTQITHTQKSI